MTRGRKQFKKVEYLQVPEHASEPHGTHGWPSNVGDGSPCDHPTLTHVADTIECRMCGRSWKDHGTAVGNVAVGGAASDTLFR